MSSSWRWRYFSTGLILGILSASIYFRRELLHIAKTQRDFLKNMSSQSKNLDEPSDSQVNSASAESGSIPEQKPSFDPSVHSELFTASEVLQLKKELEQDVQLDPEHSEILSDRLLIRFRSRDHAACGETILTAAETALSDFESQWEIPRTDDIIPVLVYSPKQFQKKAPKNADWARAVFDGNVHISIPPCESDDSDLSPIALRSLRHELLHASLFLASGKRSFPAWFDEGLALLSECSDSLPCDITMPAKRGQFLEGSQLLSSPYEWSAAKAATFYLQSAFLIRTLLELDAPLGISQNPVSAMIQMVKGDPLKSQGPIDSTQLLSAMEIDFSSLLKKAESKWNTGVRKG